MTARTLEEIEALAAEATPGPYEISACHGGAELMLLGGPSRKYVASIRIHQVPRHMGEWEEKKRAKTAELLAEVWTLLAIAQEQRAEIAMLKDNASTAAFDKVCDQLGEANRENEEQRAEIAAMRKVVDIARVCANEGNHNQCPRTDDHHIALLEMDKAIKAIGTKR